MVLITAQTVHILLQYVPKIKNVYWVQLSKYGKTIENGEVGAPRPARK